MLEYSEYQIIWNISKSEISFYYKLDYLKYRTVLTIRLENLQITEITGSATRLDYVQYQITSTTSFSKY